LPVRLRPRSNIGSHGLRTLVTDGKKRPQG
jgi:hypothetical protein